MKKLTVIIDKSLDGKRIESVLKSMEISKTLQGRLKRTGNAVLLDGSPARIVDRVYEGNRLEIIIPERKKSDIFKWNFPLDILYEDEDILAVNKPRSMPTHPSKNHQTDTLANAVAHYLNEDITFHAITRLDKDTSGIVLIAKNAHGAKKLTEDIKKNNIQKEYTAIVNGSVEPPIGTASFPIERAGKGMRRCVSETGKKAITRYETEKKGQNFSLVRLFPITGRTHQIRVHLSHMGNPIYGDSMYGAVQEGEKTLLHCRKITFIHPIKNEEITVEAPLPEDMKTEL